MSVFMCALTVNAYGIGCSYIILLDEYFISIIQNGPENLRPRVF